MDDFIEGIGGLIIGIMIAAAIIAVIIYVVIPGAIIYFFGRTFYRQLKTYRLVGITQFVLVLIGLISIGISTVIIVIAGEDKYLIALVPASLILFVVLSVLTLGIWAFTKKAEFLRMRYLMRLERVKTEHKIKRTRERLEYLKQCSEKLRNEHSGLISQTDKFNDYLKELCMMDAQTYTIKLREWEDEIKRMPVAEMAVMEKNLKKELKQRGMDQYRMIENSIKLCLIRQKEIETLPDSPVRVLKRTKEEIEILQRELVFLERVKSSINRKYQENERAYSKLLSLGIVLD